ncbi:putative purine nucleoside permease [Hypoxylon trugodes]|uniref:putative purine nucleoside permease n=1 Tax=Hypoxylon trugodes TaxID=326681 RepID=UPI00218E3D08|nr:putative purine nucleoside permease [Hypoxylon trugodes]KAI1383936.1 putative purine nucleoside permease [Hypoxylon trugodes]
MLFPRTIPTVLLAWACSMAVNAAPNMSHNVGFIKRQQTAEKIAPKVVIISMFAPEADVWYTNTPNSTLGTILANNITVPGLSPLFPDVHCTQNGEVCQLTAGEGETNAATSIMSFLLSPQFDLTQSYFLTAGIAGINPKLGTLGSVALSRFSVQVALQYEIDAREKPENFSTGYLPNGAYSPDEYPSIIYGTEVMEVNENLRDVAANFAKRAELITSEGAGNYCAKYADSGDIYAAATEKPGVISCDTATSDVYFSGTLLSEAFENTTKSWTNQSALTYCVSAQEDTAVLNALLRAAITDIVDFSRIVVMRTGENSSFDKSWNRKLTKNAKGSDFDRPPPSVSAFDHLRIQDQNGFDIAVENLYLAGVEIVQGIIAEWNSTFHDGIKPTNYIGDIFGTLGGTPDFGPGSLFNDTGVSPESSTNVKRSLSRRKARSAHGWK